MNKLSSLAQSRASSLLARELHYDKDKQEWRAGRYAFFGRIVRKLQGESATIRDQARNIADLTQALKELGVSRTELNPSKKQRFGVVPLTDRHVRKLLQKAVPDSVQRHPNEEAQYRDDETVRGVRKDKIEGPADEVLRKLMSTGLLARDRGTELMLQTPKNAKEIKEYVEAIEAHTKYLKEYMELIDSVKPDWSKLSESEDQSCKALIADVRALLDRLSKRIDPLKAALSREVQR